MRKRMLDPLGDPPYHPGFMNLAARAKRGQCHRNTAGTSQPYCRTTTTLLQEHHNPIAGQPQPYCRNITTLLQDNPAEYPKDILQTLLTNPC